MKIRILITGSGSLIGQGVIKCLKQSQYDIDIICADYIKNSVSPYLVKFFYLLPDIFKKKNKLKSWMILMKNIISNNKIDIIIPCLDFEIPFFAKNKNLKIFEKTLVLVSDYSFVSIANDKFKTFEYLRKNSIYCPNSCLPNNLKKFLKKNKFPLVVKPRFGHTSNGVTIVNNYKSLVKAINNIEKPIIQTFIKGKDNEYTCGVVNFDNKNLSTICLQRYLKNGNTNIGVHKKNIFLKDYISDISKKFLINGPANFQLKLKNKKPYIFEINPRFSGTTSLRCDFGVNEIDLVLYHIFRNKKKLNKVKKRKIIYGKIFRYLENYLIKD
jgi:carbamoyl-phosphate synthase large subunit